MGKGSSEAYDLSLFETKEPQLHAVKSPQREAMREQKRERAQKRKQHAAVALVVAAVAVLMILMVVSRIQLTELNGRIAEAQDQLAILQSENSRLSNELAAKTSAESVDAYAEANGMSAAESYQIEYITVDGGDQVAVSEDGTSSVFDAIGAAIFGKGD